MVSNAEVSLNSFEIEIAKRLVLSLAFGGAIGLERSYHGRPAGFRTHALVCLSSTLLMLLSAFENQWLKTPDAMRLTLDPTRVAQGIMTGIGFLGGGVIVKEGLSVRGLTTAASIWITATIGILIGVGLHYPAVIALGLTLGTLSVFRWIESRVPVQFYANFSVRFSPEEVLPESDMRSMVARHGFSIANLSYRLDRRDEFFEYRMIVRTDRADHAREFSETLSHLPIVKEFRLASTGD